MKLQKVLIILIFLVIPVQFHSYAFEHKPPSASSSDLYYYGQFDTEVQQTTSGKTIVAGIPSAYTQYNTTLTQVSYLGAGDLENDGYKDVVSSSFYDGYIAILHQNSSTHQLELVALWDVTSGGATNGVSDVYIDDMNSDCLEDIVVFDVYNQVAVIFLQTNEYGVFTRKPVNMGITISRGGIGDLNNDGHQDLVWTKSQESVYVAYQTETGFSAFQEFPIPTPPTRLVDQPAIGDFNNDGRADLAAVDGYSKSLFIWEAPAMQIQILGAPNNVPDNLSVGDLDGDLNADIAIPGAGTTTVNVTWGGTYTTTTLTGIGNMEDAAIGDVDADAKLELVATDKQSYHLVIWDLDNRTVSRQVIDSYVGPGQVIIADLNGDGLNDVAYGLSGYTNPPSAKVTVHYQTGEGAVEPRYDDCKAWPSKTYIYIPLVQR